MLSEEKKNSYGLLIDAYCLYFKTDPAKIKSSNRKKEYVEIRFHIMRLLKETTEIILEDIGELLGGRDHSTVIHGIRTHEDLCSIDPDFAKIWEDFLSYANLISDDKDLLSRISELKSDSKISVSMHNNSVASLRSHMISQFYNKLRGLKGKVINETLIEKIVFDD
jgi:hypothetical protein